MTATRIAPTEITDPGGIAGDVYAAAIAQEINNLWNGVITPAGTVTGTADAIAAVCSPVLVDDPVNGQTFRLIPTANNTGAVTINLDARGAIALKDEDGAALAADEIVSGKPILFWYDAAGPFYRLSNPTTASLLDALAAQITASTYFVLLGDTTVSSPVAQVEHTFTADGYMKIIMIASGLSGAVTNWSPTFTLRHSGGAIVTLDQSVGGTAAAVHIYEAEFLIDVVSATKSHLGMLNDIAAEASNGSSATSPDRVRAVVDTGNIDAGRFVTYGMKKPA